MEWAFIATSDRGQPDAALVRRFRQAVAKRVRAAVFDRVVREHRDAVLGCCAERLWPDADAAVTAAHDAFIVAYLAMDDPAKLARPDRLRDWLLGIAAEGALASGLAARIDAVHWEALQADIAAALVRAEGTVLVHADAGLPAVQALIRWDPVGFSERELADRGDLGFPPATRMASVTGSAPAVSSLLSSLAPGFEVLGPVQLGAVQLDRGGAPGQAPGEEQVRALVRASRPRGAELARALHAAQAARSARKEGGGVRVQLDPAEII